MTKEEVIEVNKILDYAKEVNSVAYKVLKEVLEQEPKWIPVNKRLPEEGKTVMASTLYGVYPEAKYTEKYGWEWAYEAGSDYWVRLKEVIAWMPLPEPYKAESEEE